jgi:hypothetical protein
MPLPACPLTIVRILGFGRFSSEASPAVSVLARLPPPIHDHFVICCLTPAQGRLGPVQPFVRMILNTKQDVLSQRWHRNWLLTIVFFLYVDGPQ